MQRGYIEYKLLYSYYIKKKIKEKQKKCMKILRKKSGKKKKE